MEPVNLFRISNLMYNGCSVSEPEMIAESLNSFFVESIASLNEDNVEECDYSKTNKLYFIKIGLWGFL